MDSDDQALLKRLRPKASQTSAAGPHLPRQMPARSTKPTASDTPSNLGSLTDASVILQSGQLMQVFKHQDVVLQGAIDIELHLTYLGDYPYRGYFGYARRFRYEQQLRKLSGKTWRLYRHDGREFDFTEAKRGFINHGNLGAELRRVDEHTLILDYFDGRPQETYRNGHLIRLQDRNGNHLAFSYRADNALVRIASSSGPFIELHYTEYQQVHALRDDTGRIWRYQYDAHNNLVATTNPLGETESYQYRELGRPEAPHNHLLESISDATGHTWLQAEYDPQGRVISCRENTELSRYHYVHNQLVEKTDAHGRTTTYSLDEHSLICAITQPDGRYQREDYNPATRIAKITDNGRTHEQHYDARHRLLRVDYGFGECEEYVYTGNNPEPAQITQDGQTTTHTYDDKGQLTSTTTPNGATQSYTWDERGNLVGYTDAEGHTTAFAYNGRDQVTQITDPEGHSHQFAYNAQGQQNNYTNPLGQTETIEYDRLGRPTGHTNALGQSLQLAYTAQGRVSHFIDPAGGRTTWQYNDQGQLVEQIQPGGRRQRYHYNKDGLVDAIQRADGSELHIEYNAQKRITALTAKSHPSAAEQDYLRQTYRYNANGQLVQAHNGPHYLRQAYADQGRLGTSAQDGIDIETWYASGQNNNLGGIALLGQSWHYNHDAVGQVASVQQGAYALQQQHNANGQISQRQYPNGITEQYTYTDSGHLQALGEENGALPPIHYQYNPLGLVEQKNDTAYQYDPLGQITQASERHYQYDGAGNPVGNQQSYDAQNRLQSDAQYRYRYDGRGNLIEKQHKETNAKTTYSWNLFDQLVQVNHTDADGNTGQLCFEYDALNRRVKKSHTQDGQTTTRRYLYQGHDLIAILDENDQLLATIIHDQTIDTPLAITTYGHEPKPLTEAQQAAWESLSEADRHYLEQSQTERCYYYHRDHQGSITALTDEQGSIVERLEYDAFGNILQHQKEVQTHNPFAYTGREFDRPDLYYYRARYYDPTQRRFISADPIGLLSGDFNFYRYVGNNPVNWVDAFGLEAITIDLSTRPVSSGNLARAAKPVPISGWRLLRLNPIGILLWALEPTPISRCSELCYSIYNPSECGGGIPEAYGVGVCGIAASESGADADSTSTTRGAVVAGEETGNGDPCEEAKRRKDKHCSPENTAFSIGNARKGIAAIIKIAIAAKTKPSQAKKLIDNNINCSKVNEKIENINKCLQARKDVTDFCFGGISNASHTDQEDQLLSGAINNLQKLSDALGC
jgi:RHS repeat-associated protein